MGHSLIKAAAVVNIALAAFAFVACSGDDGKDGKNGVDGTSCLVQPNVAGNFDIICGDAVIGQLTNGAPGPQGPQGIDGAFAGKGDPGEPGAAGISCSGAQEAASPANPYGGVRITCGTQQFFVSNGAPGQGGGPGPSGDCNVIGVTVPVTNDNAITLTCSDQRSATVLVCPAGSAAAEGSTGLLLDDQGRTGQCLADGTISRGTTIVLSNICGNALFDPKTSFCQRTITTAGTNLGEFAQLNASGAVEKGNYPSGSDNILDPESGYNKTNLVAGVNSVVLPLCGLDYQVTKDEDVGTAHFGRVYNANYYCGRTLVVKIGEGTSRYGVSDGTFKNGKPVSGGALDIDPNSPNTNAWAVLPKGQCLLDLATAEKGGNKINGFNFTTSGGTTFSADRVTRDCSFMGAITTTTGPTYTYCPETADVLSLDDIKCVDRLATTSGCIYHSVIDKTCLVQGSEASLYGTQKGSVAAAKRAVIRGIDNKSGVPSTWKYNVDPVGGTYEAATGIKSAKVGTRFGLGFKTTGVSGALDPDANLWSKACVTLSRTVYIAVNDQYLSNKAFKEDSKTGYQGLVGPDDPTTPTNACDGTEDDFDPATGDPYCLAKGPLCGGDVITPANGSTPAVIQPAVAFEDGIACLNGTLSLDFKLNNQSIGYDGSSWDKPLFCVQDNYGLTAFCKITSPSITNASTCNSVSATGVQGFKDSDNAAVEGYIAQWNSSDNTCRIIPGITVNEAGISQPQGPAFTETTCTALKTAQKARLNPVEGTVSAVWTVPTGASTIATVPTGKPSNKDHMDRVGYCVVSNANATADKTLNDANKSLCNNINALKYGNGNDVPVGTNGITAYWIKTGDALGATSVPADVTASADMCVVTSDHSGAISADNCAWITEAFTAYYRQDGVSGTVISWGSN